MKTISRMDREIALTKITMVLTLLECEVEDSNAIFYDEDALFAEIGHERRERD